MTDQSHSPTESTPTIAVTGAAGYIGSRVVKLLRTHHPEWKVRALDNFYLGTVREIEDVSVEHVDIRNRERLEDVLSGANIVLHLAAISGVDDCETNQQLAYDVNVQGTNNVVWFCRKTGAGLIFPFSMAVIGDPEEFPITVDDPRQPMNWYGRTKVLNEQAIDTMAEDAFPAHLYLKSNLYGEHKIDGQRVSKGTVINFFVNRVFSDEPITVYEPGTQSRNFIHVKDVAAAYIQSVERLLEQLDAGETGTWKYEIASDEDPSVQEIAKRVQSIAADEAAIDVDIELVENPRGNETLVSNFEVDTTKATNDLGWQPQQSVDESIRNLIRKRATDSE
jgi:UDP-glucose 4-epimerase